VTCLPDRIDSDIPEAVAKPKQRWSIQLIWMIPIIAASLAACLRSGPFEHGRTITITFKTGEGLETGKTKIKYKEIEIGKVESIAISEDRSHVIVTAELRRIPRISSSKIPASGWSVPGYPAVTSPASAH
jgi:paraquat-inducible protein B